jgi:hypothetical protein
MFKNIFNSFLIKNLGIFSANRFKTFLMLAFELSLKKFVTKELLYYSWVAIKSKQKFFFYFSIPFSDPLTKYWFYKISDLLQKRSYKFSSNIVVNKRNSFSRAMVLGLIKAKVFENAFLFLFLLHISDTISFQTINLTECLRLYFNNIVNKFVLI